MSTTTAGRISAWDGQRCQVALSYLAILAVLLCTALVTPLPIIVQMAVYTYGIINAASEVSLEQLPKADGSVTLKAEQFTQNTALLFPLFGSSTLLALYLAFKYLSPYYVNLLLMAWFAAVGALALGESLRALFERPSRRLTAVCWSCGAAVAALWFYSKHWVLSNLVAVGLALQGVQRMSLNSFCIAVTLMVGFFIYDIFWVFGTGVMIAVAKKIEAPAMLILPGRWDPWEQSILGLGDIVLPGLFIAMVRRFEAQQMLQKRAPQAATPQAAAPQAATPRVSYARAVLVAYELALILCGFVMFHFKRGQPALLYLVPACLGCFFGQAFWRGDLGAAWAYCESEAAGAKKKLVLSSEDANSCASVTSDSLHCSKSE